MAAAIAVAAITAVEVLAFAAAVGLATAMPVAVAARRGGRCDATRRDATCTTAHLASVSSGHVEVDRLAPRMHARVSPRRRHRPHLLLVHGVKRGFELALDGPGWARPVVRSRLHLPATEISAIVGDARGESSRVASRRAAARVQAKRAASHAHGGHDERASGGPSAPHPGNRKST